MTDREIICKEFQSAQAYLCRLGYGRDLIEEIGRFCESREITSGIINGVGALQNATLGFYNQTEKKYQTTTLDESLEIISLLGNISIKEGAIFPHLHIAVSDDKHRTLSGHLMSPSEIFACEISILRFEGVTPFHRRPDPVTGLPLWQGEEKNDGLE